MGKLNNNQKKEILEKLLQKKSSQRKLAAKYGVTKTAIQKIWSEKDLINLQNRSQGKGKISNLEIENGVLDMFDRLRSQGIPVSGPMTKIFALRIADGLHINNFKASSGWLQKFKARNDVVFRKLVGENYVGAKDFLDTITEIYETYDSKDIFNCDETALFYKTMANNSLIRRNGNVKQSKERITILLCCSKDGEKLPPLFIGKSKSPRVFKNLNLEHLDIFYEANKNAWMTKEIFVSWLTKVNQKFINQNRKIIMMLDNCSSHIEIELSNVKLVFLPANTTSLIQPLDAGIIKNFKDNYKKLLMDSRIMFSESSNIPKIIKSITILDAIMWSKIALDQIAISSITKCFETILNLYDRDSKQELTKIETEDCHNIIEHEINDVIHDLQASNKEEIDSSDEDTSSIQKDDIYRILYDLKKYATEYCPDNLNGIYLLENTLMQSAKPPNENILRYFLK